MTDLKICVTGATGGLGSRVLHHLLHTVQTPPSNIIVSTTNTEAAALPRDLVVRQGDYLSPSTLQVAYEGVEKLLLVSYPSIAYEIRVKAHTNAINAAVAAGVKHIYYTSLAFSRGDSKAAVMQAHLDTESYLKKTCENSGTKYTIIREGIYSESYPLYLGYLDLKAAARGDTDARNIILPCGSLGGISWVARDELGEGTARIMTDPTSQFDNQTVLLTGATSLSLADVAKIISDVWGWKDAPLQIAEVGPDEFIEYQSRRQSNGSADMATRDMIAGWSTSYPAIEKGDLDIIDPLLQQLLRRDLKTIRQTIQEGYEEIKRNEHA